MEARYEDDDDDDENDDDLVGDLILMIHPKLNIVQAVLHIHLSTKKEILQHIHNTNLPQNIRPANIFLPWALAA